MLPLTWLCSLLVINSSSFLSWLMFSNDSQSPYTSENAGCAHCSHLGQIGPSTRFNPRFYLVSPKDEQSKHRKQPSQQGIQRGVFEYQYASVNQYTPLAITHCIRIRAWKTSIFQVPIILPLLWSHILVRSVILPWPSCPSSGSDASSKGLCDSVLIQGWLVRIRIDSPSYTPSNWQPGPS